MAVFEVVAIGVLGYLLWVTLGRTDGVAGCGETASIDCDHVLASRWSHWLSLPVALPALLLYVALLTATWYAGPWHAAATQRRAWLGLAGLTFLAAAAAVWFIVLQAFVLGAFCAYCMVAHVCSLVLFALVSVAAPRPSRRAAQARSAARLLGTEGAASSDRAVRGQTSDAVARSAYRRAQLAGGAAAVAMVILHLVAAPASFTVTAEADLVVADAADEHRSTTADRPGTTRLATSAAAMVPHGDGQDAAGRVEAATPESATPAVPAPSAAVAVVDRQPPVASAANRQTDAPAQRVGSSPPTVRLLAGKVELRIDQQLLLGAPSAELFVVTLFDYTCPHCRGMHAQLRAALDHYGDRLAIVLIPIPLNTGCNPAIDATSPQHAFACHYARLALAVWKNNRAAFPQFHDWLFAPIDAPPPGVAGTRAASLVRNQRLNEAILDPWVDAHLKACIELYRAYGGGQIPKLILAGSVVTGDIERREDLFALIDAALARRAGPP
jgi:uncharacterized membrane protein/protein-disulfide isomerase